MPRSRHEGMGINHDLYGDRDILIHNSRQRHLRQCNYSFSDSLRLDKQFDTIVKKIEATLYFNPCTNLEFNLEIPPPPVT